MTHITLIAHNVRSAHNVGSLLRTAEGLGVEQVVLGGYTPYPPLESDSRLPHEAQKTGRMIAKTALGAEKSLPWRQLADIRPLLEELRTAGYVIAALEQSPNSTQLPNFIPSDKIALLVGREVEGLEPELLALCDQILEIPMFGQKESFNVGQAAAMALYHLRFTLPSS